MKKLVFFVLLLIFLSNVKASKYPSQLVLPNNDTIVAIKMRHVDTINTLYLELQKYKKLDSLNEKKINELNKQSKIYKSIIDEKDIQINTMDSIIVNKNKIIKNKDEIIEEKDKINFWTKIKFALGGSTVGIILTLILV